MQCSLKIHLIDSNIHSRRVIHMEMVIRMLSPILSFGNTVVQCN